MVGVNVHPAVVKKGSTGHYTVNYEITIPSVPSVPMNDQSSGPSEPIIDITSVKVQGSIGTKAKNIYIYLDGVFVGYLPSLKTSSWSISKIKIDVSGDVISLKIPTLSEEQSHTLTIIYDWTFTSTGTEKITGPWSAVCTSMFGTNKTPYTDVITVRINK